MEMAKQATLGDGMGRREGSRTKEATACKAVAPADRNWSVWDECCGVEEMSLVP